MTKINVYVRAHDKLSAVIETGFFRNCLLALSLLASVLPAKAIPAPPPLAPQLREATMTVTVQLIEATNGEVSKITQLCKVSGKIPVYSDNGRPASFNAWRITGCTMPMNGENLTVSVWGAKAISEDRGAFATAGVTVVSPGAAPSCEGLCGRRPLADSRAEIRVSGSPKLMNFGLNVSPASVLNAKPSMWLEGDVEIVD
ncbi:hypothetical protein [Massilia sp. GCM10023247]|uniref:hypothetical protein n=1 Tax=Massilia sp. GCM10023247 TaxID=3252643 RepID=UPI00360DCFA2